METGKKLSGKVAIVTGGASGIGAATARLFAQHGASVLLTDSNTSQGKTIEKEITSASGTASFAEQDVRNEGRWGELVAQAEKTWGRVDILCNIAGISGRDPKLNIQTGHTAGPRLADQTLEHWNWVMEINSTGVFLGTKAAVPAMQRAGGGSIINISSICGIIGSHANAAYHASKGQCASLQGSGDPVRARQDPRELGPSGLRRHADDRARPFQSRRRAQADRSDTAWPLRHALRHSRRLPLPRLGRLFVGDRHRAGDRRRHDRELIIGARTSRSAS